MKHKITKLIFSVCFFLFAGLNHAFAQEETVTVDTLITVDDDGNEIRKIIKKKVVRFGGDSESNVETEVKKLRKKKVFISEGEGGDHEIILKRLGAETEGEEIEIEMRGDGDGDSMIWVSSEDDFSFGNINPAILKKEMLSKDLAESIGDEPDADAKERLVEELDALLDEIFDLKIENMQNSLAKKAERLEKERAKLEERRSSKDEMIEKRKAELLKKKDDTLRW